MVAPGVDWNDAITSVDRVEIWWIHPAFFAIFQVWNVGLDNVAVHASGAALVRNGSGVNPLGYASPATPTLGAPWTATVDLATPGHLLSAVAVSIGGATDGIFPGGAIAGELLVLPGFVVDVQAGSHAFPLPPTVSLLGACVATQAATVASSEGTTRRSRPTRERLSSTPHTSSPCIGAGKPRRSSDATARRSTTSPAPWSSFSMRMAPRSRAGAATAAR